jgi:hypothetical protein
MKIDREFFLMCQMNYIQEWKDKIYNVKSKDEFDALMQEYDKALRFWAAGEIFPGK